MKAFFIFVLSSFLFSVFTFPTSTLAARPSSMYEKFEQARSERIAAYIERIVTRLSALADYDELLALRIEARALEILSLGEDTYVANAEIKTAREEIAEVKNALLESGRKENYANARALLEIARNKLSSVHERIGNAIEALLTTEKGGVND